MRWLRARVRVVCGVRARFKGRLVCGPSPRYRFRDLFGRLSRLEESDDPQKYAVIPTLSLLGAARSSGDPNHLPDQSLRKAPDSFATEPLIPWGLPCLGAFGIGVPLGRASPRHPGGMRMLCQRRHAVLPDLDEEIIPDSGRSGDPWYGRGREEKRPAPGVWHSALREVRPRGPLPSA